MDEALATQRTGVIRVGDVANTMLQLPVTVFQSTVVFALYACTFDQMANQRFDLAVAALDTSLKLFADFKV